MKKFISFFVAMLMTFALMAQNTLNGKTVLFVYGGWAGHDPNGCKELFVPWLKGEGANVVESDKLSIYKDKELMAKVDLIVQVWTMGSLQPDEEEGLLSAIKNGAGIAGWHGGLGDSFRNNTEYQFMVGGQWVAHPGNIVDYDVNVKDKKDPVMKGIKTFHMRSEQYYMHVDPAVKVLATTKILGKGAPWIEGVVMPAVWKKVYGKGRVFYSSLGHVSADFDVPEAFEIMKRGIKWAVR